MKKNIYKVLCNPVSINCVALVGDTIQSGLVNFFWNTDPYSVAEEK